jgi:hypothetical protein
MIEQTGVWQTEDNLVYRLAETGSYKRDPETKQYKPELQNDVMFHVQVINAQTMAKTEPGRKIQAKLIAEHIVKLLNEHPFVG